MAQEIERQYLVASDAWRTEAGSGEHILQGYLSVEAERTVRVRLRAGRARLTVKGPNVGPTRTEFEYEVPVADAEEILDLCLRPVIRKTRHLVERDGVRWEIDVFEDDNAGLVLAEVELDDADARPELPEWIGEDVTGDARYYNANLVRSPYRTWA